MVDTNKLRDTSGTVTGASGTQGATEDTIFEKYPPAQFTVAGLTLGFPVLTIRQSGGNRIVKRERPYRDGAKLDDTGSEPIIWTLQAIFNNSLLLGSQGEQILQTINGGLPLYPDVLNLLISNFDFHETGDLVVPTIGVQRARAQSYDRTEVFDGRDQAIVSFMFCEDNEDSVDFRSITAPSGGANAKRLAATTELDTESFGSLSEALTEVQSSLIELENFVNAPGDAAQDIDAASMRVEGSARRSNRTFSEASRPGRNLFLDPQNSRGPRKMTIAIDLAARQRNEARRGQPTLTNVVFRSNTTIFRIAAFIGQDPFDLIGINPDLDPNFIPKGTLVKVFVTDALLNGASSAA